ncbi:cytochrome P450 [Actinomadura parmotrematis]|uniref:Cytochrome P450 n=1 Tax=Actinomadura parmotrematis TaxID=2864039 RepID=A0ABS7FZB1_9ACTN|nr:cytochrome P450 [Actinomadura parmotrematis]MBW8485789.1 cytochrome P450 [Actinomadura parmotrematis]
MTVPPGFPDGCFGAGHPGALYEEIRAHGAPVRHPELPLWLVGTYAEVHEAAADPAAFRSGDGILISEIGHAYDAPPTMMHTDPPDHTRYRRLVAPAFRPKVMRALEGPVRDRVRALLDALPAGAPADVVGGLAVPLPLQVICLLLGVPEDDWPRFHAWSEAIVPGAAEGLDDAERDRLRIECGTYLVRTAHERRDAPRDDVISQLATLTADGDSLTDLELVMFLIQLLVAGNETTRHAISGGLHALAAAPGQWAALRARPAALLDGAVAEILRWTAPVVYFLRTATRDVTLGGAKIAAGERVMLLYGSANRDPAAYGPDAGRFDIARAPEPAGLAFGFGPHYCLGAALARLELRILLEETAARHERLVPAGDPVWNASPLVTGLRRLPLALS